jgi:hypothetical protein
VLLFVPAASAPSLASWIALAGGTLRDVWLSQPCHGSNGIALARAQHALPVELQAALTPALTAPSPAVLTTDFQRDFVSGTVLDLVTGHGTLSADQLPRAVLGELVQQVGLASRQRDGGPRNPLPVELAVYAPNGQAKLIFVAPRGSAGFAAFRARVRAASMHASYYGLVQHKHDASGAVIPTY